jgi:hypothetical protein
MYVLEHVTPHSNGSEGNPVHARLLCAYLFYPLPYSTYMHSRYFWYVDLKPGACPSHTTGIWLAKTHGAVGIRVCAIVFWSYLAIIGSASSSQINFCHPLAYSPPPFFLITPSQLGGIWP